MATLQQMRNQLRTLLDQPDNKRSDFTNVELNGLINEGIRYASVLLEHPRDFVFVQAEESVGSYTLLSDTLFIRTAYFGDRNKPNDVLPLEILSEETLSELKRNWLDNTDTNRDRPRRLIILDKFTIFVDPRPNATESAPGKEIILNYVFTAAKLTSDAQEPQLPLPYHDLMQYYAAHIAYLGKLKNPDMSNAMLTTFNEKIAILKPVVEKETKGGLAWQWGFDEGVNFETFFGPIIP